MTRLQIAIVVGLALGIGYGAGYFTHRIRFPYYTIEKQGQRPEQVVRHSLAAELGKAKKLREQGELRAAQKLLRDQLRLYPQAGDAQAARELLGSINTELFFSDKNLYGKTEYVVERGDSLARIARKLNSTTDMIMRANSLDSTLIHPGDRLVVPDTEFTLTIDLPQERVVVHHGDGFFKQYPIQSVELPRSSQPRIATKVSASVFWRDGERVAPGSEEADEATPWIHLGRPGYILYAVSEENGLENEAVELAENQNSEAGNASTSSPSPNPDIPSRGIALLRDDLVELQLLLRRGTPVTIILERK